MYNAPATVITGMRPGRRVVMVEATKPLAIITKKKPVTMPLWYLIDRLYPKVRTIDALESVFGPGLYVEAKVNAKSAGMSIVERISIEGI